MRWFIAIGLLAACSRIESSGPPTEQQLATACIKHAACSRESVRTCLDQTAYASAPVSVYRPEEIRCINAASANCAEVLACIDACPGGACTIGPCDTPGEETCKGTRIETCDFDKQLRGFDCAPYDETCKLSPQGYHYCAAPNAAPCGQFGTWCEGDTLVHCEVEEHRVPCGRLYSGGKCLDRRLQCGYGDECVVEQQHICVGNAVQLCSLGKNVEVDCVQLGFAGCVNGTCVRN